MSCYYFIYRATLQVFGWKQMINSEDISLINDIKTTQSSTALLELASRHTGIYCSILNKYVGLPSYEKLEITENKLYNIYNCAINYKPEMGMKFSTYLGESTKWICLAALNKNKYIKTTLDISQNGENQWETEINTEDKVIKEIELHEDLEEVEALTDNIEDLRFKFILKERQQKKPKPWRDIGKELELSGEWCRQIYKRKINFIKKKKSLC